MFGMAPNTFIPYAFGEYTRRYSGGKRVRAISWAVTRTCRVITYAKAGPKSVAVSFFFTRAH